MDRNVALERALSIATLLKRGQRRIQSSSFKNLACGLLAFLPIFAAGSRAAGRDDLADIRGVEIFREILIFGSVARGEPDVGDLDMIILDSGFCSPFFERRLDSDDDRISDWYHRLKENLYELLTGWFGFKEHADFSLDVTTAVDLHILPVSVLWSEYARTRIAKRHTDPRFLENAFSAILRYSEHLGQFVPTTLEELRTVHRPDHVTP